jgi:hypothetical protein
MITDRELVERAAAVAGRKLPDIGTFGWYKDHSGFFEVCFDGSKIIDQWNPLNDDADVLTLAVKLRLIISFTSDGFVCVGPRLGPFVEEKLDNEHIPHASDAAKVRRAIVRAAAALFNPATAPR